jgi:tight adherence protein B
MRAFRDAFPDSLDLLVSGLRAGLSFSAAMQIVAEESPEPVRSEFAITVEEQALGVDFREALTNLTDRVDSLDLRFFVTAVLLQRDTGGNLAEILANTAALIRDRFRVLGDIATFTAQGRLTGGILACLPIGMGLFMIATAPEYFKPMLEAPQGRMALIVAGVMQLMGVLVIRQIVRIKV